MTEPSRDPPAPDPAKASAEGFIAWLLDEPEPVPLSHFPLQTEAGRAQFFRAFFRRGEPALFDAVAHIWSQLAEPQAPRCTAMGLTAGTGGSGKMALVKLLTQACSEAMEINHRIPELKDYCSAEQWHAAVLDSFAEEEVRTARLIRHYSDILDGRPSSPPVPTAQVIEGLWTGPSPGNQPAGRQGSAGRQPRSR